MLDDPPRLLLVAHGTASEAGARTTAAITDAVRAARPGTVVDLCFLDVVAPRLPDVLDDRPTVVVPMLLSTGYHVQTDIPEAVAGRPNIRVAAHLGPDPRIVDALVDRLGDGADDADEVSSDDAPAATVLVAAGSSRSEAAAEFAVAAQLLQARMLDVNAEHRMITATMTDDLPAVLAAAPDPLQVAVYLLAEGAFVSRVERAAREREVRRLGGPIGAHPQLVALVWQRYDEIARTR